LQREGCEGYGGNCCEAEKREDCEGCEDCNVKVVKVMEETVQPIPRHI